MAKQKKQEARMTIEATIQHCRGSFVRGLWVQIAESDLAFPTRDEWGGFAEGDTVLVTMLTPKAVPKRKRAKGKR